MFTLSTVFFPDMTLWTPRLAITATLLITLAAFAHSVRNDHRGWRIWVLFALPVLLFSPIVFGALPPIDLGPVDAYRDLLPTGIFDWRPPWFYELDNAVSIFALSACACGFSLQCLHCFAWPIRLCGAVCLPLHILLIIFYMDDFADLSLRPLFVVATAGAIPMIFGLFWYSRQRVRAAKALQSPFEVLPAVLRK